MTFEEWWESYKSGHAKAAENYAYQSDGEEYPLLSDSAKEAARAGWIARERLILEAPLPKAGEVKRVGDMHPKVALGVERQSDGDMVVTIELNGFPFGYRERRLDEPFARVEFCTGGGRGRSFHTWVALMGLMEAIRKDNKEKPIQN